jgi:hypothetical protein
VGFSGAKSQLSTRPKYILYSWRGFLPESALGPRDLLWRIVVTVLLLLILAGIGEFEGASRLSQLPGVEFFVAKGLLR